MTDIRMEGVHDITPEECAGTRGADGTGVLLPTVGPGNPGPTTDRGVETNTAKSGMGGNAYTLPMQQSSFDTMGEQYPTCEDPHEGVS